MRIEICEIENRKTTEKNQKINKIDKPIDKFSSVQFSHSVMSNSLQPYGLQQARPPYPSQTPGVWTD